MDLRRGEALKTFLMFFYFLLTIALIYILKPVQKSLFLAEFGAENLRYIYIGEGLFLILVVQAYIQFAKHVSKGFFYYGILGFFIMNLAVFWFLFRMHLPGLSAFFYIWHASFSITMTTIFWTLANDIFHPEEAKRLFGFIISGGSIGGILGGVITHRLVHWIPTEDLLLIAAGVLGLCFVLVRLLWKEIVAPAHDEKHASGEDRSKGEKQEQNRSVLKIFLGSGYLMMLAALVMFAKMGSTIIDNQFNAIVEAAVPGKENLTAFFGGFFASLNAVSFLMQLFMTSLCLKFLGVGLSIWILPAGLAILTFAATLHPVLAFGIVLRMFDGSANYSVQQASKEVLYLPVSSALRRRVKPLIDMLGFRAAKSLGGLFIVAAAPLLGLSDDRLGVLVLFLIPFWFLVAWRMKASYSKLLREKLVHRGKFERAVVSRKATDVLTLLHHEKDFQSLESFMHHRSSSVRKLAATALLTYAQSARDLESARRIVQRMTQEEAFEQSHQYKKAAELIEKDIEFLESIMNSETVEEILVRKGSSRVELSKHADRILLKLGDVLHDPEKGLEPKRYALQILELIPRQETADLLLHSLDGVEDYALRFVIAKALNRIHDKNPGIKINRFLVKREIAKEVRSHQDIQKLHQFYGDYPEKQPREYLGVAFQALIDESVERIFNYVELLYPYEMVQTIYENITGHHGDPVLRAHAMELLNNTLEPDLILLVRKVLENGSKASVKESEALAIIKKFVHSPDRWFSLTGRFLIEELHLLKKWPELEPFYREEDSERMTI